METFDQQSVDTRIRWLRRRTASSAVTIGVLAAINLAVSPGFLWFLFPAIGMSIPLGQRLASLWADGVHLRDIFGRNARRALRERADATAAVRSLPSASQMARDMVPADVLAGAVR